MKRGLYLFIVLAMLLSLPMNLKPVQSQTEGDSVVSDTLFVPGQVIVGFNKNMDVKAVPAQAAALADEAQAAVLKVEGSAALLEFGPEADVESLVQQLQSDENVAYAEPNFIYSIPNLVVPVEPLKREYVIRTARTNQEGEQRELLMPISMLQNMKRKIGSTIQAVYPNDPGLWNNTGWNDVQADIVSPNTTPSKNVCVIDTGVDYSHPDLSNKILLGKDFVNADNDPMDDNGHGTHVAGIIAAKQGNGMGMAGVSTGKVIAVKALTAQGWGTSFEIAQAIYYCANRTDVSIINMSLGGNYSTMQDDAVWYAVMTRKKLLVAAAGNSNSSTHFYPAALSVFYPNKVLSVAASHDWCKASYSNYGSWVDIIAPGTYIYSTLPWRKPFTMAGYPNEDGYGYMSGTSMAAPFVSAVAARAWGYKPTFTNSDVSNYIKYWGNGIDSGCWPEANWDTTQVNVAAVLQRGAVSAGAINANTGLALTGATITAYRNNVVTGSAIVNPVTTTNSQLTYTYYPFYTEIINLPVSNVWGDYQLKVSKSGSTASPQAAFVNYWSDTGELSVFPGTWVFGAEAFVPIKSSHFTATYSSFDWEDYANLVTWLPNLPKPIPDGQPARFIVGHFTGFDYPNYFEADSTGNLSVFPFARQMVEGSTMGIPGLDSTIVLSKPGYPARPYYNGDYVFAVYSPTSEYPTSFFIWKDGVIKKRVNKACDGDWWKPLTLSQRSGIATYTVNNICGGNEILPYVPSLP